MKEQCEVTPQPSTSKSTSVTNSDTKENVSRVNEPHEAIPQPSTSKITPATTEEREIADEILREARINSLNLVFKPKATAPSEAHESQPQRQVAFTDTEQNWLNITKEKDSLRKIKGVYSVKRSRHEAFVMELFNIIDVRPPKRKSQADKENEARDRQLAKVLRRDELITLRKEERQRRLRHAEQVAMGSGQLHPSETPTDLEKYKVWTPAQDWPLSDNWTFKEKKEERNPQLYNRDERHELELSTQDISKIKKVTIE